MRGKTVSFDEAISGVLLYEIATLLSVARNDDLGIHATKPIFPRNDGKTKLYIKHYNNKLSLLLLLHRSRSAELIFLN
ncbi:hypothetical protein [Rickettsia hoogstraalii]|uniref:hypothetical protein n=1 Tax=Rickettsia hoogstraalii TaxID=467174 RepID=UPI0012E036BF|nr:hypothetical protein [Rickettsia hoogstraalii]